MNGGPVNCSPKELSQYIDFLKGGFVPCVNSEPCTCSPGQGAESLQTCCSDTSPSVRSRSMNIASRSYQLGKKMVAFHGFPYLRMSKNSMGGHGEASLMSSREDSLVNHIHSPEEGAAATTTETFGMNWSALLRRYGLDSSSLRTSPDCSPASLVFAGYAAGLIDGEGSIALQRSTYNGRQSYQPEVRISLAEKGLPALRAMHQTFGGTLSPEKPQKGRWSATWRWRIGGAAAGPFLMAIGPLLLLKAEQAVIVLAVLAIRDSAQDRRMNGTAVWTSAMVESAQILKDRLTALNQRGTTPNPPGCIAEIVDGEWRPTQQTLPGISGSCSVIWPRSGMTAAGQCWELPMSARRTSAIGSGSLLPTPLASNTKMNHMRSGGRPARSYAHWPTPRANDAEKRGDFDASNKRNGLPAAVKLWPTPTAMNSTGGSALCKWGGSGARAKLRTMVTSQELNGALNPAWVEWLMGWPIGWTSLAALHERECEYWQAANAAHGDGAPADELWFDEEAGAPSGDHGVRQAIPRVCSGVQARAARLKAIGNGQVPRAAAMAWRMLANILADLPTKTSSPVSVEI